MREKLHKHRLLSFFILSILYCLIVWLVGGNPWFYFGIFVIADATSWNYVIYRKFKRPKVKKGIFAEWGDAIIFAVIAATIIRSFFIEAYTIPTPSMEKSLMVGDFLFVSKLSYGPRVPMTPLAFPFSHHTLPIGKNKKAYSEFIKLPYYRMGGFGDLKNNDIVVFNYPAGDTILTDFPETDYYQLLLETAYSLASQNNKMIDANNIDMFKSFARTQILSSNPIHIRPLDKKENYIKRCIGIAGDTLQIIDKQVFINGKLGKEPKKAQFTYSVKSKVPLNDKRMRKYGIAGTDKKYTDEYGNTQYTLKISTAEELNKLNYIDAVESIFFQKNTRPEPNIFPESSIFNWNRDNYGPLYIPKKGDVVKINMENIAIYERVIRNYENNKLKIKKNGIYINGTIADNYRFKQNYYFMMGDNRHNSLDSRFWGFVPEDHIVGKAVFIWMSWDAEGENIFDKIRWSRIFSLIGNIN